MNIEYRDGLLFVDIELFYKGQYKAINNVVIDTGASSSIISPDCVDDIGIYADVNDRIMQYYGVGGSTHSAFIKQIDEIPIEVQQLLIQDPKVQMLIKGFEEQKAQLDGNKQAQTQPATPTTAGF